MTKPEIKIKIINPAWWPGKINQRKWGMREGKKRIAGKDVIDGDEWRERESSEHVTWMLV